MKTSPRRMWLVGLIVIAVGAGAAWSLHARRTAAPAALRSGTPALLHFHMDCPSCKQTRAMLARIEAEYGERLQVVHLDVRTDANEPMVDRYGVKHIPLLVLLDAQGRELWRNEGPCNEGLLREQLRKVVP